MDPADLPPSDSPVVGSLMKVQNSINAGEYADALTAIEETQSIDPDNIYVSAIARQVERLFDLSLNNALTEERQEEILAPIPGLMDRAMRLKPHWTPTADPVRQKRELLPPTPPAPDQLEEAVRKLKLECFQRASQFVIEQRYDEALVEVRRVFVFDPENHFGKEYEQIILDIQARNAKGEELPPPVVETPAPPPSPVYTIPASQRAPLTSPPSSQRTPTNRTASSQQSPGHGAPSSQRAPHISESQVHGSTVVMPVNEPQTVDEFFATRQLSLADRMKKLRKYRIAGIILFFLAAATGIFSYLMVHIDSSADKTAKQSAPLTQPLQVEESKVITAPEVVASPPQEEPKVEPVRDVTPPKEREKKQAEPAKSVRPQPIAENASSAPPKTSPVDPPASKPAEVQPVQKAPEPFVAVERDPQIVRLERPVYPEKALETGAEGQVVVQVQIDVNGKPIKTKILKSTNPLFEEPAIDAVMKSTYTPAIMGTNPVVAWMAIPFTFKKAK